MNNAQVITNVKAGVLNITAHSLSPKAALTVYKFKKALRAAYLAYIQDEGAIAQECGIKDAKGFNSRLAEIGSNPCRTEEEQKEYESMASQLNEYNQLRSQLLNQEVPFDGVGVLSYEQWFKLQGENKAVNVGNEIKDVLGGALEEMLEGVLWEMPEE